MPPRRLALKTQATVPTEAAHTHSISTGGGLWVDEFTPAAPELCSLCENARLLFVRSTELRGLEKEKKKKTDTGSRLLKTSATVAAEEKLVLKIFLTKKKISLFIIVVI